MIGVLRPKRPLSSAGKEHARFPNGGLIVRAGSVAAQRYRADSSSCPTTSGNISNEGYTNQPQKYEEGGAICGSSLGEYVMRLLTTMVLYMLIKDIFVSRIHVTIRCILFRSTCTAVPYLGVRNVRSLRHV